MSVTIITAFRPGRTSSLEASGTSTRVVLPHGRGMTLRVSSSRQEGVYIAFGDKDVVATVTRGTTTDGEDVVQLPPGATHVAAITSHGAAEVKFTRGLADGEEPFDLKAWSKQAAEQAAANLRERTRPRR